MADILHEFPVFAPVEKVFEAISTPAGLNAWWTLSCRGEPVQGAEYELGFGPGYDWRARVDTSLPDVVFELEMTEADDDWLGTRVGFSLSAGKDRTNVRFSHRDWSTENEHFRISCYCWAMYLRLMRRYVEFGEFVEYARRLDV